MARQQRRAQHGHAHDQVGEQQAQGPAICGGIRRRPQQLDQKHQNMHRIERRHQRRNDAHTLQVDCGGLVEHADVLGTPARQHTQQVLEVGVHGGQDSSRFAL